MNQVTAILIGAGQRGKDVFANYGLKHPQELKFVGVADIDNEKCKQMMELHNIPEDKSFNTWQDILELPKFADVAVIATLDKEHYGPAKSALEKGYHVLVEKPLSDNAEDCVKMGLLSEEYPDKIFVVAHVLRYTKFFSKIKELILGGAIGNVMTVNHNELVGRFHYAHSFCRGNWRNSDIESPMILQKCCHDLDILVWLIGKKCLKVSSFGALEYFTPKYAPEGAPDRCLDGCPAAEECPYHVEKIYLTENIGWPTSVISTDLSYEGRVKALKEGKYGKCVFKTDNNVVDHQIVNMFFEDNVTAQLNMTTFTDHDERHIHIFGTQGEIIGDFDEGKLVLKQYPSQDQVTYDLNYGLGGHGGGDTGLMKDFLALVQCDGVGDAKTAVTQSVESHVMAFAAEESRLQDTVVDLDEFVQRYR